MHFNKHSPAPVRGTLKSNEIENWRERWLVCINELTSLDLQKKNWLDTTSTNLHWSFAEFMCSYFDDLGVNDNYVFPLRNKWITKQEFELIKVWHESLANYSSPKDEDYDVEAVLNDPKWLEIIHSGVRAKNNLSQILNEREKQVLAEENVSELINRTRNIR